MNVTVNGKFIGNLVNKIVYINWCLERGKCFSTTFFNPETFYKSPLRENTTN